SERLITQENLISTRKQSKGGFSVRLVQGQPAAADWKSSRSGFLVGLRFEGVSMWERCTVKGGRT
ncbi:hypothetical protein OJQ59_004043, partial [Escherichia coli]|nr:hypothetical protein [Salmonella enterica]ECT3534925.1 hypothetical protein [Salmonella enterica subsp. enterica serovar Dublin]